MPRFCLAAVVSLVAVLWLGGPADAAQPDLYATYSTNCTFTLMGDSGATVSSVASGSYQLVIETPFDFAAGGASCDHVTFQINGPGVSLTTTLGGGDADYEQYTVDLQPNSSYVLQDSTQTTPTRLTLSTTSAVVASTPTTSTPTSTTSASSSGSSDLVGSALLQFRGTLTGAVTAKGGLSLKLGSKAVASLKAGRYTVAVKDASKTAGFTLQELSKSPVAITGKGTVGTRKVTVSMNAGQWFFYSPGGAKHYFFVLK